jgi:DNA invertase Pin-like site-specific DNA recombinase
MTKITPDHLQRAAYIYIRQSTLEQVHVNLESKRRQYALAERARHLGFSEAVVIDEDLGRSGGGTARPGFDRLIGAIGSGVVGAVFAIEASRLARNGRDWHTLLEFCGLVGSLIIDEEGIYDPRLSNDRLLLGMKGTISEMELSAFRQRSREAIREKSKRGELLTLVAIGYVRASDNRLELDPDKRVRAALQLVFQKFHEFGSVRQVQIWLSQERIDLPTQTYGPTGRSVIWRTPGYRTVYHILTNPIYGGAYVRGRTTTIVRIEGSRKRVLKRDVRNPTDWEVLIPEHHPGYITWDEYLRNQALIADNANKKGPAVRGSVRHGHALLAGLVRCGVCGSRMGAAYGGRYGRTTRYRCRGAEHEYRFGESCFTFGGYRVEEIVGREALRVLSPAGAAASAKAVEIVLQEGSERRRQVELALESARYEASRAERQYDAVDPANRLVAADLEARWNARLLDVQRLEAELAAADSKQHRLTAAEQIDLLRLGTDLESAWNDPAATPDLKKRILRTLIREIVVRPESDNLEVAVHWQGGDHTVIRVPRPRPGQRRAVTSDETATIIAALARRLPDNAIAAVLNRTGHRTAHGRTWTRARICSWRSTHGVAVYRLGEQAERGELSLNDVMVRLGISKATAIRLIKKGSLPAQQVCPGSPYVIAATDIDNPNVLAAIGRSPVPPDSGQLGLELQ